MFAGAEGIDGDSDMRMFRRTDGNRINVLAIQHAAIVLVDLAAAVVFLGKEPSVAPIDIRHGDHIASRAGRMADRSALAGMLPLASIPVRVNAGADRSDAHAVVLGFFAGRGGGPEIGNGRRGACHGGSIFEEVTARAAMVIHVKNDNVFYRHPDTRHLQSSSRLSRITSSSVTPCFFMEASAFF